MNESVENIQSIHYKYSAAQTILRAIKEKYINTEQHTKFDGLIDLYGTESHDGRTLYAFIDLMLIEGLEKNQDILNFIKKDKSNQKQGGRRKKSKKKNKKTLK